MPYIYALIDPTTHQPRYIGCSWDVRRRWYVHQKYPSNTKMAEWIRAHGSAITVDILEEVSADAQETRESYWIKEWRARGAVLFNVHDPLSRYRPPTAPLPPRWRQVLQVLAEAPLTMAQLAERLGVSQKTARSYLSEAAKHATIRANGPWGRSVYVLEALAAPPATPRDPQIVIG